MIDQVSLLGQGAQVDGGITHGGSLFAYTFDIRILRHRVAVVNTEASAAPLRASGPPGMSTTADCRRRGRQSPALRSPRPRSCITWSDRSSLCERSIGCVPGAFQASAAFARHDLE